MLNIQSLNPGAWSQCRWKIQEIRDYVEYEKGQSHNIPFIALTETWLNPNILDAQVSLPNYIVTRCDRAGRGGGVLLFSHEDVPLEESRRFDDGVCQVLFCKFAVAKTLVCVFYRPPDAPEDSFSCAMNFVNSCIKDFDESFQLCILGDFNFPNFDWSNGEVRPAAGVASLRRLLAAQDEFLLNQYVSAPTRGSNVLDLFFTNNPFLVTNVSCQDTILSDHRLVDISVSGNFSFGFRWDKQLKLVDPFRTLDFNRGDLDLVDDKLSQVKWNEIFAGVPFEDVPALFTIVLFQVCELCIPARKPKSGKPKKLHALRRRKKRLFCKLNGAKLARNSFQVESIQRKIALISYEMKEVINDNLIFRERLAVNQIKTNPKSFYSYAKSFSSISSGISMLIGDDGTVHVSDAAKAGELQSQFSSVFSDPLASGVHDPNFPEPHVEFKMDENSLKFTNRDILDAISEIGSNSGAGPDGIPALLLKKCANSLVEPLRYIWSESFKKGIVPVFYKNSLIYPLFKKGNRAKAANYRPISMTSHIIKIFERVLRKKIVEFLEVNNLLSQYQHGFRSGRSCLTQLLGHFDDICSGLVEGKDTDSIYLDYAKAFDRVDHRLLILKLKRYNFHPMLIRWISSFLLNRTQEVVINGTHSCRKDIISGVPQGTVLGPVLFIIFINDLEKKIGSSNIRFFADDTRISKQISTMEDVRSLQCDLDVVCSWSKENNMQLHEHKFELMSHRSSPVSLFDSLPFCVEQCSYDVSDGVSLYPTFELRDLGVVVSSDLSWSSHINKITAAARSMAYWVLSVFRTRERFVMMTLYKSMVRSHLEYCCPLWHPTKIADIEKIENVQRSFTRRVAGMAGLDYWSRLIQLKIMSLQRRRERFIIFQMWKILIKMVPNEVGIVFRQEGRLGIKAVVPSLVSTSSASNQSIYDRSFAVVGPRLWNLLPSHLTVISSLVEFKNALAGYMAQFIDEPPVVGYPRTHSNTLAEVSAIGRRRRV